jgi:hypothetical protein
VQKNEFIGKRVVQLEPDNERLARSRLARLPAPANAIREVFQRKIAVLLKSYFERADDSLFDLADKASTNEEQNLFFDSMREVRVRRHGIENCFRQEIDAAFGDLNDVEGARSKEEVFDTLKADALSLVHDDDLEEMVAIDTSVARSNSLHGEAIQYISLRLDSLLPIKVYQKNNPVGPDVLCRAYMAELKKLDVSLKAKLLLFRLFDKNVIDVLGDIYLELNDILIESNVLPSLPSRRHTGGDQRRRSNDRSGDRRETAYTPNAPATAEEVSGALNSLLGSAAQLGGAAQGSSTLVASSQNPGAAPIAIADDLLALLTLAQRMPQQAGVIHKSKDVRGLIKVMSTDQGSESVSMGRVEDQVMNLVNMLFDFILEDRNLASAMKMLISRMQIPIIKVALSDKSFFAKRGHVARKLLNEMSTAAIGWQGDEATAQKDPLYRKVENIVQRLLNEFDTDVSIFSDLYADFTAFLDKERKRVAILERRTLDAEDGKAKAEVARTTVALELEVRTQELVIPDSISPLLHDAWSNVLFVTSLKHGYFSAEWLGALDTLDELLWSILEPATPNDRQRLIKSVPSLLKKLRAGLDTISYNPFEMSSLFKALEEVHLQCIRGRSPVKIKRDAPVKVKAPAVPILDDKVIAASIATVKNSADSNVGISAGTSAGIKADVEAGVKTRVKAGAITEPTHKSVDSQVNSKKESTGSGHEIEEIDLSTVGPFGAAAGLNSILDEGVDLDEPDASHLQQVETFVQGAWFDMKNEKGVMMRCRLAAYIKPTRKYIFVNRNGMKMAERSQYELALALKKSDLRALDNSMMFDRALETVVTSLRKPSKS